MLRRLTRRSATYASARACFHPCLIRGVWSCELSGLFSLDAFAGGLVAQTLMALYFHLRFDVSLGLLAVLFFAANLLSALSFLAAPALARRFGLLNTMVFTHLPSNLLLILVPLMPTFPLAAALLLLRQTLSATRRSNPPGLYDGAGHS